MERVKKIIENNKGIEFVVMTHNKEEYETLRDILVSMGFGYAILLDSLEKMMNDFAEDYNYCGGWRISESRGIAFNNSVDHWKRYYSDILEINENGDLTFVEDSQ